MTDRNARQAGLTDERIREIHRSVPNHHIDFARAIEREVLVAHSADARNGEGVAQSQAWRELRAALNVLAIGKMSDASRRKLAAETLKDFDNLAAPAAPAPVVAWMRNDSAVPDFTTNPKHVELNPTTWDALVKAASAAPAPKRTHSARDGRPRYSRRIAQAPAAQADDVTDYKACFTDTCLDLAAIHTALGIPDDEAGGAEPILGAIAELQARQQSATPASPVRMTNEMRSFIEGMSVSVDVSTGKHDAGNRYYGFVSEVMDDPDDKHGVTLLVQDDVRANFYPTQGMVLASLLDSVESLPLHAHKRKIVRDWINAAIAATPADAASEADKRGKQ